MTDLPKTSLPAGEQPAPLRLSRVLHARRTTVWEAWTSAEHIRRWFCPATYTAPEAVVELQVGGRFEVCMRSPGGQDHWTRGTFVEVTPHQRLVIDMVALGQAGAPLFRAYTEVDFSDALGGTRLEIVQTYTFHDPSVAAPMVAGASEGWRTTLDKLDAEVVRLQGGSGQQARPVVHDTFRLQRTYPAPLARVWRALTDPVAKPLWFTGTPGRWELIERHMDVRAGGRERLKGQWIGGATSTFEAVYHDVVAERRLVYSYEMHLGDQKISVSLATMELETADAGTTLTVTEQGAFLDGYDDAGSRRQGTEFLLDALGAALGD